MKTFAAVQPKAPETRRVPLPTRSPSATARQAQVHQILHGQRLQTKLTVGAPDDKFERAADRLADRVMRTTDSQVAQAVSVDSGQANDSVIQRYELSTKFCLVTSENKRIRAAHQEAVDRTARTLAILGGTLNSKQEDGLKKYFGKDATDTNNIKVIKKHYSNIQTALNEHYTYYCVGGQTAPKPCEGATNAQTMGGCHNTVLRNDGIFDKTVKTEEGDIALCMDIMRKFSQRGLANIIIHENLHRSGVCGHFAICTDQADGECASPHTSGNCGSLANASFIANNPDSYGCFALQAKLTSRAPDGVPRIDDDVAAGIRSLKGRGQPLPESTRSFFEPRFGADFSQVRVHTDSVAGDLAQRIEARAFAVGRDIVFGQGQYAPDTGTGKKLLAHELTHTIQQSSAKVG